MPLKSHIDGAVFAEHLAGTPPTVVALHGWGRDRDDLRSIVAGRRAILVDLPGFGSSPAPEAPSSSADYAGVVARVLEESGVTRCVLVGHSFGGRVAVRLAAARPDLVAGVLFLGVPLVRLDAPSRPSMRFRIARLARRCGLISEAKIESLRRKYGSADYAAAQGVMRSVLVGVLAESYDDDLRRLRAPVGFCWGARDTAAPPRVAERAAEMVSNVVYFNILADAGHDVALDAPEACRDALTRVIEACTCD